MHRHYKNIVFRGLPLEQASKAMILLHGRGGNAAGILEVANELDLPGFALLAPQANQNTWYPYSFMAPVENNEPGLSTALDVIRQVINDIQHAGIATEHIYFLGFSQGACLASEYLARHAEGFGGAFIYSGGVIGGSIDRSNYRGNFNDMPMLIGCSDVDAHVPLHRVQDTIDIFTEMGAQVTERIYPDGPHAILEDEIKITNRILNENR